MPFKGDKPKFVRNPPRALTTEALRLLAYIKLQHGTGPFRADHDWQLSTAKALELEPLVANDEFFEARLRADPNELAARLRAATRKWMSVLFENGFFYPAGPAFQLGRPPRHADMGAAT